MHGDFFPWDLNLGSLVLMGVFLIHLAVQVQAISSTPLSPGWAPAVNWSSGITAGKSHGSQIHQSEDNSVHTLNQPPQRLEPMTY